jgi:hypothetical protein
VIRDMLAQLETHHAGLTAAKKKDAIDQVISGSGTPDVLVPGCRP